MASSIPAQPQPSPTTSHLSPPPLQPHAKPENAPREPPSRKRKPIRTYHCAFCNHLLLASTRDVLSLPRRKEPALDRALILPLPRSSSTSSNSTYSESESESESEAEGEGEGELEPEFEEEEEEQAASDDNEDAKNETGVRGQEHVAVVKQRDRDKTAAAAAARRTGGEYTILLSTTTPDRRPVVIRRADGFEKRLLIRCGRCRVVVAYYLGEIHFLGGRTEHGGTGGGEEEEEEEEKARDKGPPEVVYVLPGALVETGDMGRREIVVEKEEWGGWAGLGVGKEK
ncbi:hypothetical protein PRK78_005058 [Emydomyces testavorans]|uniref:STEEP1 domain-containing protein n=1 Tax=Emydomyces testavorans TaxID=2070801 RepID=A0AAF0DJS6_9EURO|nr:hypothetical protein PRK78_005058 [Emydomyces testavorans]